MTTRIKKTDSERGSGLGERRRTIVEALGWQVQVHSHIWSPPTDFFETEDRYIVRVEIAGMRDAEFEVRLSKNILSISGMRRDLPPRKAYHQMEIRFGEFQTSVDLPGPIDIDNAVAEYDDGFLIVSIPKAAPDQIRIEE